MTGRSTIPEAGSPIPLQRLGRTDMHITRVGFGAWAIGGADWVAGWGRQDDSASIASIRHAIHRGITIQPPYTASDTPRKSSVRR
jgi:hypothetical protein